jgi:hypothetical protein
VTPAKAAVSEVLDIDMPIREHGLQADCENSDATLTNPGFVEIRLF